MTRRRALFSTLCACSAGAFFILAALWVRTFFATDHFRVGRWVPPRQLYMLHVRWGGSFVDVNWSHSRFPEPMPGDGFGWEYGAAGPSPQGLGSWVWWDHFLDQPSGGGSIEVWRIQVRPWLLLVPPAILPLVWLRSARRRRRRAREGLCLICGYDLRASGDRCPECGTAAPRGRAAVIG